MRAVAIVLFSLALLATAACEATVVEDPNGEGGGGSAGAGGQGTGDGGGKPGKQYPAEPASYDFGYYQWVDVAPGPTEQVAMVGLADGSLVEVFQVAEGGPLMWSWGAGLDWSEAVPVPGVTLHDSAYALRLFEDRGVLVLAVIGSDSFLAVGSRDQMVRKATIDHVVEITQHPDGSLYGLSFDENDKVRLIHWVDGVQEGTPLNVDVIEGHGCEPFDGRIGFDASGDLALAIQCGYAEEHKWLRTGYRDGAWRAVEELSVYRINLTPSDAALPDVSAFVKLHHDDPSFFFASDAFDFDHLLSGAEDAPMFGGGLVDPWGRVVYLSIFNLSTGGVFVSTADGASWAAMQMVGVPEDAHFGASAFERTTGRPVFAGGAGVCVFQRTPVP